VPVMGGDEKRGDQGHLPDRLKGEHNGLEPPRD
jgi:hypothetical protein